MYAGFGVDTNVLMHDFSIKRIQDIKEGDIVLNENKKPVMVKSNVEVYDNTFTIAPNDKGEQYNMCYNGRVVVRNKATNNIEVKLIKDIIEQHNVSEGYDINNYKLIRISLDFDEKETELEPYFYGLYLADNKSTATNEERWEELKKIYRYTYDTPFEDNIPSNVIHNQYIYNSTKKRLELLSGIIDGCGLFESDTHCFEMRIKDENVANQIVFLARSLGLGAGKRDLFSYNGSKIVKIFKVYIYGDIKVIPTKFLVIKTDCLKNYKEIEFTIYPNNMNKFYRLELENGNRFISGGLDILSF